MKTIIGFIIVFFILLYSVHLCPKIPKAPEYSVVFAPEPVSGKTDNINVNKEKRNLEKPDEFIKSKNMTFFVNNPYNYKLPSSNTNSRACLFLINEINKAKYSIDAAIYGIDKQPEILNALLAAKKRGVVFRAVSNSNLNGETDYKDTDKLKEIGTLVYDNSKYLMHDKFFIIDDKILFTGSMNITSTGCGGYNSNSVIMIENSDIISAYKKEFAQMFSGKFKKEKLNFSKSDDNLSAYFSPVGNSFEKGLLPQIKSAKNQIRVSIFSFTHKEMANELINAAKRGIDVKIIADATGARGNTGLINHLRENNIKVKVENWGGKNHEKTVSIDGDLLIIGSANFSYSGFYNNDENTLIIKDGTITSFYNKFFDYLFGMLDDKYLYSFPPAESLESGNSCHDGIDNDFDGNIDMDDTSCKNS